MSKNQDEIDIGELTKPQEHKLRAENRELRKELNSALEARVLDEAYEEFVTRSLRLKPHTPHWTMPGRSPRRHEVIPVTCFSDWHLDEVVRAEEVQNKNRYNREIAERRMGAYFRNVCKVARNYVSGFQYPGIVVAMLGDNFSGNIHEELKNTNADALLSSLLHWLEPTLAGLRMLADEFKQVWVVSVAGNHGRNTPKPICKMRARDNFDWLFAKLLERELEKQGEKRVHWLVSEGQKAQFQLYDTKFIASHGDECKGGSGIAGMLSPQLIAMARMKKVYDFDVWLLGHWHTLAAYRGIRCNGTGKGYDEFASIRNFDFQVPQQDFFLVAPERGVIASWPIFLEEENGKRGKTGSGPAVRF